MNPSQVKVAEALAELDLPANANWDQVRQAYRELVKVWHPDRFPGDERFQARATAKIQAINAAHEVLKEWFTTNPDVPPTQSPKMDASPPPVPPRAGSGQDDQPGLTIKILLGALLRYALIGSGTVFGYYAIYSTSSLAAQKRDFWLLATVLIYSADFSLTNLHLLHDRSARQAHPFATLFLYFYLTIWGLVAICLVLGLLRFVFG